MLIAAWVLSCCVPTATAREDMVTLNFVNADVESVVKAMGEITGKNFLLDPRVKGTINIVSARPVSYATAYQMFLSALRLQGFTAVENRGTVQVVPEADAKLHAVPTVGAKSAAGGSQLVTRVFRLRNESAASLVPILRPLVAPNNTIAAYPGNNSLVVTDYADNIQRLAKIIDDVDQPTKDAPSVVRLQYASAADMANTISRLMADGGAAAQGAAPGVAPDTSQRVSVVADLRTNSLILRGENPLRVAAVRKLIAELDTPGAGHGNLHVIYLKYADAQKMAEMLRGMVSGAAAVSSAPPQPSAAGAPGGVTAPAGASSAAAVSSNIQADVATNSLIINAPEPVYNNLRAVVEKLDSRRAQVFVEALIVEVSSDKAAEFGIQWLGMNNAAAGGRGGFGAQTFGGAGSNIVSTAANPGTIGKGLSIGLVKGQVTLAGIGTITNIGLLARALESTAKANILSTPNLVTLDNEEAKIIIGQNVPFITGQYASATSAGTTGGASVNPFQTIERKDVGLTLKVRPQISEGGAIKLRIFQEVSSVQDSTNAAGIITNKRSIESIVEVEDGAIVALGGLVEDRLADGREQVPVLGDVPVVGSLFRYDTRRQVKTNLMVFLRPLILRDDQARAGVTMDRYDLLLGEQAKTQPKPSAVLPDLQTPAMPDPRRPGPMRPRVFGNQPLPGDGQAPGGAGGADPRAAPGRPAPPETFNPG